MKTKNLIIIMLIIISLILSISSVSARNYHGLDDGIDWVSIDVDERTNSYVDGLIQVAPSRPEVIKTEKQRIEYNKKVAENKKNLNSLLSDGDYIKEINNLKNTVREFIEIRKTIAKSEVPDRMSGRKHYNIPKDELNKYIGKLVKLGSEYDNEIINLRNLFKFHHLNPGF